MLSFAGVRKTLFGQLAEWHLILRSQHYALKDRYLQMKVLSQQFNCLSYILMIIQTLLRKWMKQASSSLLEKEEQWRHLFHLLKQHYKMKELSAGHVWGQMLNFPMLLYQAYKLRSGPNLPSILEILYLYLISIWLYQTLTYCTFDCTSNLHVLSLLIRSHWQVTLNMLKSI